MRRIIAFFTEIPPACVQETTIGKTVIPVIIGLSSLYYIAHFYLLFILEPAQYPGPWLSLVAHIQNHLPAVNAWAHTSHALREQFPSLYALGLIFGMVICIYAASFSNGITLFRRNSDTEITARQFARVASAVIVGNLVFLYVLFFWPDRGPLSPPITDPTPLRGVVETKIGNQLLYPFTNVIAFYWFGANLAWLRIMMTYHCHSWRSK